MAKDTVSQLCSSRHPASMKECPKCQWDSYCKKHTKCENCGYRKRKSNRKAK